jgi:hypothetical protein
MGKLSQVLTTSVCLVRPLFTVVGNVKIVLARIKMPISHLILNDVKVSYTNTHILFTHIIHSYVV